MNECFFFKVMPLTSFCMLCFLKTRIGQIIQKFIQDISTCCRGVSIHTALKYGRVYSLTAPSRLGGRTLGLDKIGQCRSSD